MLGSFPSESWSVCATKSTRLSEEPTLLSNQLHLKSASTNPGIARDPPHSVEDNSHTVRKFDIDDVRSLYMPSRGFGSGQDVPFAPARSRYHRTDPSRTGSLPIPAAIPVLGRLIQERKLF